MGGITLAQRCESFIKEFGEDLVKKFRPLPNYSLWDHVHNLRLEHDDSFEVFLAAELRGEKESYPIRFEWVFYSATMEDPDVLISDVKTFLEIGEEEAKQRLRRAQLLGDGQ